MIDMKYVVVQSELGIQMVVFPTNITHYDLAEVLSYVKHRDELGGWKRVRATPVSAGFTDGFACYGCSGSLGISSHKDDTDLLDAGGFSTVRRTV